MDSLGWVDKEIYLGKVLIFGVSSGILFLRPNKLGSVVIYHISIYSRFSIAMVYYAILLNATRFKGDDFLNFSIGGLVEIASSVFTTIVLRFLPRRVNLCGVMALAGVSLLCILFIPPRM